MNRRMFVASARAALVVCTAVLACKSNAIGTNKTTNNGNDGEIGPSGGTVSLSDGTAVRIPAGALTKDTPISLSVAQPGNYPAVPSQYTDVGDVYAFEPHGLSFQTPVVIDVAYHSDAAATSLVVLRAEQGGSWAPATGATFMNSLGEVSATSFSFYTVASTALASDGGPTCAGVGPDKSAPTGTVTNASGTIPVPAGDPTVDLSVMIDGYATSNQDMSQYADAACTIYGLDLLLTPYMYACGYYKNGVARSVRASRM